MFRKCIIFYATNSSKEVNKYFDTSSIDSLVFSKIKTDLFPVLAERDKFDLEGKKQQAKEYIASLMKVTDEEMEYMERFIAKDYKPELLFEDTEIVERIRNHPMALWKCNRITLSYPACCACYEGESYKVDIRKLNRYAGRRGKTEKIKQLTGGVRMCLNNNK